jgi:hypothetical protein
VPIAADIWRAGYGIDAQGGCAVGPASTRAGASGPAGALGAAIAGTLFERGWIAPSPASRAVRLTEAGRAGLRRELDLDGADWAAEPG